MIAAVTDLDGRITGAHRTWLNPSKCDKAPIDSPRRAMGHLLGNAVRFETARDVMAAGEGIETMLSLRCVMPTMPLAAALSAAHLAAILFPPTLRRLYVVRDNDLAWDGAMAGLFDRARTAWIDAIALSPHGDDFNGDLRRFGIERCAQPYGCNSHPRTSHASHSSEATAGNGDRTRAEPVFVRTITRRFLVCRREPRSRPSRGRSKRQTARLLQWRPPTIFRRGPSWSHHAEGWGGRFTSRNKIVGCRHPPLRFGRCRFARRCRSGPPAAFRRHEGRDGRGRSDERKSP